MDKDLLSDIERARQAGAIVLLKWDGERDQRVYTVAINHPGIDFVLRMDTDDMASAARELLSEFWKAKGAKA